MNAGSPSPRVTDDGLGAMLGLVRSEMVRATEARLAASDIDLRFTQYLILKRLSVHGPMMATELARAIELDGGAMTRQLDQLEGRGYLRRSPHEQDRRALRIELTDTGAEITRRMVGCSEYVLAAAQRSLSADERLHLNDYLERVLRALRDKT